MTMVEYESQLVIRSKYTCHLLFVRAVRPREACIPLCYMFPLSESFNTLEECVMRDGYTWVGHIGFRLHKVKFYIKGELIDRLDEPCM